MITEASERSEEFHEKKKEIFREVRKWTELKYPRKEKESIRLSPRNPSVSPKFSHQIFVKNPIRSKFIDKKQKNLKK